MNEKKSNVLSILSLILGIVGLIFSFIMIGIIPAIVGLVLGIKALIKKQSSSIAIGGIVTSILGCMIFIVMCLSFALLSENDKVQNQDLEVANTTTITGIEYEQPSEIEEPTSDWATEFTPISDFRYTVNNGSITLVRYEGEDTQILLSPVYTLDGTDYTLISMGDDACFLSEGYITSVIIPEGVEEIGASCFNSCTSLEKLYLPSTLKEIPSGFLSYLHDYKVYCNSTMSLPSDRDSNNYVLASDDMSNSGELGENLARALNGMMYGANSSDEEKIVEIYFGGTDEQWSSLVE